MKELYRYIDTHIIDEYAEKSPRGDYALDIDSLPDFEKSNFLHELMRHDTAVRDLVLSHMQILIDERLPVRESVMRQSLGLKLITAKNGDTYIQQNQI